MKKKLPNPLNKKLRILCFGYREWAQKIYIKISKFNFTNNHEFIIINNKDLVSIAFISSIKPDLILFYGWSELISNEIISNYTCLMLHPSPLPKYRGGSPIQNQIINNDLNSEICIFIMNDKLIIDLEVDKGVPRTPNLI